MKANAKLLLLAAAMLSTALNARAASGNWNVDAAGNWSTAGNWTPAAVPGTAAGDTVGLTFNITAARTVTIDTTSRTVGTLNIGDSGSSYFAYTLTNSGGATLTFNNSGSTANLVQSATTASDTITVPMTLSDNLSVSNNSTLTLSGVISGAKTIAKSGSGTLTFSGVNTFTAGFTNLQGTVSINTISNASVAQPLGAVPSVTLGSSGQNATLQYTGASRTTTMPFILAAGGTGTFQIDDAAAILTRTVAITGSGGLVKSGAGTLQTTTAADSYSGNTTVNAGVLRLDVNSNPNTTYYLNGGTLVNNSTTFNGPVIVTADGSGLDAIGKQYAGTLTSSGGNYTLNINTSSVATTITMAGAVTAGPGLTLLLDVQKSSVILANSTAFAAAAVSLQLESAATLDMNKFNATFGALSGSGAVSDTGGGGGATTVLTLTGTNSATFSGVIANGTKTTALVRNNTGTQTLSGPNTFTGGSTINGGTILIGVNNVSTTSGALGPSTAAVTLGDTTGSVNASLLTGGAFTFANAVTVASGSSGTAALGGNTADASSFAGNITLNKSAALSAVSGGNVTFSGIISGTGFGITKSGAGIVTLSGINTYTGGTTISAGTLRLGTNNVLASTGSVTMNGGTFSSRGFTNMLGALIIQSSSTVNLGTNATPGKLTFASGSYTAGTLTISNWTGTAGVSGTRDKIFITAAPTATFLTNISFLNFPPGAIRLGTGEIVPTSASAATKLAITVINGGLNPTAGAGFSVIAQAQTSGGAPGLVTSNTAVSVSLNTGTGTLGGTLTGTITAGSSYVTISGLTYSVAESGVILTATRTSGDSLTAGNSSSFIVNGPVTAAQSTVSASPASVMADGTTAATITVTLKDANSNPVYGKTVTLAKSGGSSSISAASGPSDVSGVVTFTVKDLVAESATYTATDTTDGITVTQTASVTFTPTPWYNSAWTNRFAIVIDHTQVASTLTNFPVLINLTNSSLQQSAQSGGNDILFTSTDGTNKLAHEIENYTNSNGALVAWVNVPILSSNRDTILYLYYCNASATNQQNPAGTWTANFNAVWHLNGAFTNSTSANYNGTNSGTTAATGKISSGRSFVGTDPDYITVGGMIGSPSNATLSAWANLTTRDSSAAEIISFGDQLTLREDDVNNGTTAFYYDGSTWIGPQYKTTYYAGTGWHYFVGAMDITGHFQGLYIDGVLVSSTTGATAISFTSLGPNTIIGKNGNGGTGYNFTGTLDEVRVSNVARSAGWILTEYNNQNSPATFYSVGSPESASSSPTKLAITSVNGGSSPTVGAAFSVVVQAQDAGGTPRNVLSDTAMTLSVNTGSGTLGGTLTGTITAGTNSVTISGVTYGKAENGVILTATRTSGDSLTAGNSSSFNVSTAVLTVSSGLTANNKVYDRTNTATISSNTVVLAGVLAADTGNVSLSTNSYTATFASATVGSGKVVTVSGLTLTGSAAGNYTLTQPSLSANITAKGLTVTGVTASNKVYDGNTTATVSTNGAALVGIVGGDTVTLGGTAAGTFATKTVAAGKTVTVSGLTLGGADAANYTLTQPTPTANITAKGLTVTGVTASNKVYNGNTTATVSTNSAALVGVVGGDTVTLSGTAAGTFANSSVATGKTVTVSGLTLGGADAANYTLTQPTTTANITAKGLTVTGVTASNKVYDGNTNATVSTNGAALVGIVGGDTVTLGGTAAGTFATKTVAAGKTVTVSGLTLGGADAANYTLTQPTPTANITAKGLTVTGVTASNKVYDGNTTATVSTNGTALAGVVGGDTVSLSGTAAGTFADSTVTTGKTVTVSGLTLSGTDAGNYTLTQPTTTADITAASTLNAVTSSLNPALPGSNITFTSTLSVVSPGSGTPTGNVIFKDGTTVLGTNALNGSAVAAFSTTALSHGSHTITAEYAGDGNFLGSTNSLSPNQVINSPPAAANDTLQRYLNSGLKVRAATLLANDTDPDSDALTLISVSATSAAGGTNVVHNGWISYEPPGGFTNSDSFSYVIADSGGLQATGSVSIIIRVDLDASQNIVAIEDLGNNASRVQFLGIPARVYTIQYTTNLVTPNWQSLGTNTAGATGAFEFTDTPGQGSPARFYRSIYP